MKAERQDPDQQADPSTLNLGPRVGRYVINRCIGRGGAGEVFLATDELLKRPVALKRMKSVDSADSHLRQRFLKEARHASLRDPRIAALYDVVEHEGHLILVMEYVPGCSLREKIRTGLTMDEFWSIALCCVEALEAAHRENLIHRDIKPDNIMITPSGQVKLLDFGLARRVAKGESDPTVSTLSNSENSPAGTVAYMSPEAHLDEDIDQRTDIFSLGVVFYEMLSGVRPFRGSSLFALVDRVLNADPEPLTDRNPEVSPGLNRVVLRMLAKDPEDRYASAGHLLEDLMSAHRGTGEPRPPLPIRRLVWAAALVAIVATGGLHKAPGIPGNRNVVVLPVRVEAGDIQLEVLAEGMTSVLNEQLCRITTAHSLQVVPAGEVRSHGASSAGEARTKLGANLAVLIDIAPAGKSLVATVRVLDTGPERVLHRYREKVRLEEPIRTADTIYGMMIRALELPETAGLTVGTRSEAAFLFYLCGLGRLYSADSLELRHAITDFNRSIDVDPGYAAPLAGASRAGLALHDLTGDNAWITLAMTLSRRAVAMDSTDMSGHLALAEVENRRGGSDEAIAAYRRALSLNPAHDEAWISLARIFRARGDAAGEEAVYRAAAEARPHYWRTHGWLGTFFWRQGRIGEAVSMFEQWVQCAPSSYLGYSNLGGLYIMEGRYEDAVRSLKVSLELNSQYEAYTNLGTAYFNLRDFDRAIEIYNRAMQGGLADYEVWNNLGDAYYYHSHKRNMAHAIYRQALNVARALLEENDGDPIVLSRMAELYAKVGERDSALALQATALGIAPSNPMVLFSAALVSWFSQDHDRAFRELEGAVNGGYPRVWLEDSAVFDDWRSDPRFGRLVDRRET